MELIFITLYIIVFLYSVIVHEIAHGFVALKFGDDTAKISGRLSLNPISHIDPFGSILLPALLYLSTGFAFGYAKPVPVNPYRLSGGAVAYRWVSLAGIATNVVLAIVAGVVLKVTTQYLGFGPDNLGVIFFQLAFVLNSVLAVFNSFPFPGFDGFNFLMTFGWFSGFIRQTPLANPLFMARYGLIVSLLILLLVTPYISSILVFFVTILSRLLGL